MHPPEKKPAAGSQGEEIATGGRSWPGRASRLQSVVLAILLWQAVGFFNTWKPLYNAHLFPAPLDVIAAGWRLSQSGVIWVDIYASTLRVLAGTLAAAPIGIVLGIIIGRIRWAEDRLEPIIELLRPMPPLALLPMIILWCGIGETSRVFFIAYSSFFVMYTSVVVGVRNIDPVMLRAGQSLGLNWFQLYRFVILQAVLPDIVLGLRLGLSAGFLVIVAAEFIATDTGLGYLINYSRIWFRVDDMLVGAISLGILGVTANYLLVALERRQFRWRVSSA